MQICSVIKTLLFELMNYITYEVWRNLSQSHQYPSGAGILHFAYIRHDAITKFIRCLLQSVTLAKYVAAFS